MKDTDIHKKKCIPLKNMEEKNERELERIHYVQHSPEQFPHTNMEKSKGQII